MGWGKVLLAGVVVVIVYFIFIRTNSVDYYLNNFPERIAKIQECQRLPDVTKDKECMNAITAQRMFMRR
jgi:hypothetical protein